MEIDVTDFLASTDCSMLSGSVAELGDNAGRITWQNSIDAVKEFNPLPDDAALQEFRDWLRPWGGWSDDEFAAMPDEHLRALCVLSRRYRPDLLGHDPLTRAPVTHNPQSPGP